MTRSPPLRRIIPIFLWLKIKEILPVIIGVFLVIATGFLMLYAGYATGPDSCENLSFLQGLEETSCSLDILGTGQFIVWIVIACVLSIGAILILVLLTIRWLRSNWQQATKIAKAREKGR